MNKTADRTVVLDKGRVDIYTKNGITLYAYQTNDPIDNEVFVLTKAGRGVVIELPCFYDNIRELTDLLKSEGIAVEAKLVAYHAAGASFLPEVPVYGTASSAAYNTTGGGAGLVSNFRAAFGDSFDAAICAVDLVLTAHYTPEDLKDAQTKADYLMELKEIALTCESADEMKGKVQAKYPNYSGMNYLDMTVGFFFPNK